MYLLAPVFFGLILLWAVGFLGYYLYQNIQGDDAVDSTLSTIPRRDAPLMFHWQTLGYLVAIIASLGLLLLFVLGGRGY